MLQFLISCLSFYLRKMLVHSLFLLLQVILATLAGTYGLPSDYDPHHHDDPHHPEEHKHHDDPHHPEEYKHPEEHKHHDERKHHDEHKHQDEHHHHYEHKHQDEHHHHHDENCICFSNILSHLRKLIAILLNIIADILSSTAKYLDQYC